MVAIGKERQFELSGEVCKLRKYDKVAFFALKTARDGYIPCKTFCKEIIDVLVEGQELLVNSFGITRSKFIGKDGVAKFSTDIIVNQIIVDNDYKQQQQFTTSGDDYIDLTAMLEEELK